MKKLLVTTTLILLPLSFASAQAMPMVFFTEIMYDLPGSDTGREWVELYNYGTDPVEVRTGTASTSWRFFDGSLHTLKLIQGSAILASHGLAILADNAEGWKNEHPDFIGTLFDTVISLKNTSSTIGMTNGSTQPLFTGATYDSSWGAAGDGATLERKNDSLVETQSNWVPSMIPGGTPGSWSLSAVTPTPTSTDNGMPTSTPPLDNATSTPPADQSGEQPADNGNEYVTAPVVIVSPWSRDIIINEVLPNPIGSDTAAEWIEAYNKGATPVDLAGWKLQDSSSTVYTIGEDDFAQTDIGPGGYFVIYRDTSSIALNNTGGDMVKLYWPDGNLADATVYSETAHEGQSWSRFERSWAWTGQLTPAAENQKKLVHAPIHTDSENIEIVAPELIYYASAFNEDAVLITEVFPNPDGTDTDEWIEIKNTATSTVSLPGWKLDDADGGSKPYLFPTSTVMHAGQYLVLHKKETGLSLNNSNDAVRILTPDGKAAQSISYSSAPSGESYAYDEQHDVWQWTKNMTPSAVFTPATSDESKVLGYEVPFIHSFSSLTPDTDSGELTIRGIVAVPPGAVGKQRIYVADTISSDGSLFSVYQYHGDFPHLTYGDVVEIRGTVQWKNEKPEIRISTKDSMSIVGHQAVVNSRSITLDEVSDEIDGSWSTIEGTVLRVNKGSLTLGATTTEISVLVYPFKTVTKTAWPVVKGDQARITGFSRFTGDRAKLYVSAGDVLKLVPHSSEDTHATGTEILMVPPPQPANPQAPWQYLATVPVTIVLGWILKKVVLR